jgi:23S rRNA (adenine2503-C2)-methyltransferase
MTPFLAASNLEDLKNYCREHGFPAFRASQIDSWLHTHCITDPDMMKNLPADLKTALKQDFHAPGSSIAETSTSPDQVEKFLLKLHDGEYIEMVAILRLEEALKVCCAILIVCDSNLSVSYVCTLTSLNVPHKV